MTDPKPIKNINKSEPKVKKVDTVASFPEHLSTDDQEKVLAIRQELSNLSDDEFQELFDSVRLVAGVLQFKLRNKEIYFPSGSKHGIINDEEIGDTMQSNRLWTYYSKSLFGLCDLKYPKDKKKPLGYERAKSVVDDLLR